MGELEANPKKDSSVRRLAIFASYDKNEVINDYVVYYLKELNKVSDVIFVADNPLKEEGREKIRPFTAHIIAEKHGEYDFGSYKRGYLWAKETGLLSNYDQLIYCNDSVFGPIHPFDPIFSKMERRQATDFWGMFTIKEKSPAETNLRKKTHAQSYFIVFNSKVVSSEIFSNFMHNITKLQSKSAIIENYEVGLSQMLINSGFQCDGYMSSSANEPRKKHAMKIIKDGFPFLKKSLFNDLEKIGKKTRRYDIWKYKLIIEKVAPHYPLYFIEDYLYMHMGKKKLKKQLFRLRFRISVITKLFLFKKSN